MENWLIQIVVKTDLRDLLSHFTISFLRPLPGHSILRLLHHLLPPYLPHSVDPDNSDLHLPVLEVSFLDGLEELFLVLLPPLLDLLALPPRDLPHRGLRQRSLLGHARHFLEFPSSLQLLLQLHLLLELLLAGFNDTLLTRTLSLGLGVETRLDLQLANEFTLAFDLAQLTLTLFPLFEPVGTGFQLVAVV